MAKHFLNLEPKSFNYLALYDADSEKIMENFKVIAETSKEIIWELKNLSKESIYILKEQNQYKEILGNNLHE